MPGNPDQSVNNGQNRDFKATPSGTDRFSSGISTGRPDLVGSTGVTGNEYPTPNVTPGNEGFKNPSEQQFGQEGSEPYKSTGQGAGGYSQSAGTGADFGGSSMGYGGDLSPERATEAGYEHGGETREHVKRIGYMARDRIVRTADDRKGMFASQLEGMASMIEGSLKAGEAGGPQEKLAVNAANMIRQVSNTLNSRSTEEFLQTLDHELRARPVACIAGCLALGFIGARLLKI